VTSTEDKFIVLLVQYLPSITITVLNAILPIIFEKIVKGEGYTQAFVIKITLIRSGNMLHQ
jgi:type IV secretory pathway TrbL component